MDWPLWKLFLVIFIQQYDSYKDYLITNLL